MNKLNNGCQHEWRQLHEQSILGGSFPVGFECIRCNAHVGQHELTPAGLPGTVTSQVRLVGPHGHKIATESGRECSSQIYDKDTGKLTYVE